MTYVGPSLEVKFRRDYDSAVEAAREAVETAEIYNKAGIPGITRIGGPALYDDYEEILMGYGVELVVATGCEIWNYEGTWVKTFDAIMQEWCSPLMLPKQPGSRFIDAIDLVNNALKHERAIDRNGSTSQFYADMYEEAETTPREWMHHAIQNNIRYFDAQYPTKVE